ncbi:hypothetical protein ACFLVN_03675 [Chloroflexota bacterium]
MKIEIAEVHIYKNKLVFGLNYSKKIRKYILKNSFFFEYDPSIDLSNVDESILTIPIVSMITPIAWAIGADVLINKIDRTYLHSLTKIEEVFKNFYPKFSFSNKIHVKNAVPNKFDGQRTGLLFSGGLDSVTSYIRHKDKIPDLIPVWGADIALNEKLFWEKAKAGLLSFANIDGVSVLPVKTNVREINEQLLKVEFTYSWWGIVSHGLLLLSLCAPITAIRKIGTIIIASSHTKEFKSPWGSHPLIDNNVSWANLEAIHDGYDMSRQDKLMYLSKGYSKYLSYLRACHSSALNYNCGLCEKCSRTIIGLTVARIDPKISGYCNMERRTFHRIKECLIKGRFNMGENETWMWMDIQKHIHEKFDNDKYNSKKYLKWLKQFDLSTYKINKLQYFLWTTYIFLKNRNIKNPVKLLMHHVYITFGQKLRIFKFWYTAPN